MKRRSRHVDFGGGKARVVTRPGRVSSPIFMGAVPAMAWRGTCTLCRAPIVVMSSVAEAPAARPPEKGDCLRCDLCGGLSGVEAIDTTTGRLTLVSTGLRSS